MNEGELVLARDALFFLATVVTGFFVVPWLGFAFALIVFMAWLADFYVLPRLRPAVEGEPDVFQEGFQKLFNTADEKRDKAIARQAGEIAELKKVIEELKNGK